ncbi:MAG: hypothetical protein DRP51_11495, partial [Candidatus Zixiibacteriota bacterium]
SWNPAALYVHEQVLLGFNLGSLKPRGYNKFYATGTRILKYDHSGSFGGITDLNLIAPLRIKDHHVVMNLSYVENVNSYFEFREKLYDWSDFNPLDTLDDYDPNALMQRKGGIHSANLALGTRVNKEISFGIAANIYTGKLVTDERRTAILDIVDVGGDANKIAEFHTIDSTSYSGFNFTLGLLYTSGKFRSGLTLRTPFILKATSDSTLFMESTKNGLPFDTIGTFNSDTVYIDNMTSKIEMPIMLGLGMAYNISDNWLVSGDIEYRGFEGKKVENLDSLLLTSTGDRDEFYSSADDTPNWSNVIQLRLGTEYLFDTKFGEIPLRFGARTEVFPSGNISDYTITYEGENSSTGSQESDGSTILDDNRRVTYAFIYDTDKVTGYSVAAGTGIHWENILLDVALTYTTYKQNIYHDGGLKSKNTWKNYHVNFGFIGYF